MRESFNPGQAARDFKQRYLLSFGFYTTESKRRMLVQMFHIGDDVARFKDATGSVYSANCGAGVEFEFIPVPKKLFVVDDSLHFIRRKPAKQFSRGINTGNTTLINLSTTREKELTFERLEAMLESRFQPTQLTQWEKGMSSCLALSNQFGIQGETLYIYDLPIGKANPGLFKVDENLFIQEVKDTVARLGLAYKVE